MVDKYDDGGDGHRLQHTQLQKGPKAEVRVSTNGEFKSIHRRGVRDYRGVIRDEHKGEETLSSMTNMAILY